MGELNQQIDDLLAVICREPVVLPEAITEHAGKIPTALSDFDKATDQRAFVAAGIDDVRELNFWHEAVADILEGKQNPAQSRIAFNREFDNSELNKQWRQDLLVRTNLDMARGFGQQVRGLTPQAFYDAPAWELIRFEPRLHPRGDASYPEGSDGAIAWPERWQECLDEVGTDEEQSVFDATERMIAPKESEMWRVLGTNWTDSIDNNGAAPYAFNSGMDRVEVSRAECIEIGLPVPDAGVEPPEVADFNTGYQQTIGTENQVLINAVRSILDRGNLKGVVEFNEKKGVFTFPKSMSARDVSDEPRDDSGKWTATGIVAQKYGLSKIERIGDKWKTGSGEDLPEHAQKLGIPPAWKGAHINPDPKADLQAVGMDEKGRIQRIYSDRFVQQQANAKFSRNQELLNKQTKIFAQNEANLSHAEPAVRENAAVMKLIQQTGIRPGSETDTGAEKQAYGATTLEGRHVVKDDAGNVRLKFVGKKGVNLDIPVEDKSTADMLLKRKELAGDSGKIFDTNASSLRDYTHTLDGGSFKPKDFRTLKGTQTALEEVKASPERAATMKEYKKRVMDVAKKVAAKLGNTPSIALKAYINPFVFQQWKPQ